MLERWIYAQRIALQAYLLAKPGAPRELRLLLEHELETASSRFPSFTSDLPPGTLHALKRHSGGAPRLQIGTATRGVARGFEKPHQSRFQERLHSHHWCLDAGVSHPIRGGRSYLCYG